MTVTDTYTMNLNLNMTDDLGMVMAINVLNALDDALLERNATEMISLETGEVITSQDILSALNVLNTIRQLNAWTVSNPTKR